MNKFYGVYRRYCYYVPVFIFVYLAVFIGQLLSLDAFWRFETDFEISMKEVKE